MAMLAFLAPLRTKARRSSRPVPPNYPQSADIEAVHDRSTALARIEQ
jgi:hypothetical protein